MRFRFRFPRLPRVSWRVLGWAAAAMSIMVMWMAAPLALRRLAFFRVRQVELVGIRFLDADQVLAALHLSPRASVFDDTNILAQRLRGLDGVADASVMRRPPASLKVIVREVEPVALVANARGALSPVDAAGRPMPFDVAGLDLPIVAERDSGVVGVLARVQALEPALFQSIDAARQTTNDERYGDVLLEVGPHRVLLARDAGPEAIQAVMLVASNLAATKRPYVELDGRFAGQVVVRRHGTRSAA